MMRLLPWLCLATFVPLAFIGGSRAIPREVEVEKQVVVKPRADWTSARIEKVFSAMQPVDVQAGEGVVQRTYAHNGTPPLWAVVVVTAQAAPGPAG